MRIKERFNIIDSSNIKHGFPNSKNLEFIESKIKQIENS